MTLTQPQWWELGEALRARRRALLLNTDYVKGPDPAVAEKLDIVEALFAIHREIGEQLRAEGAVPEVR